MTTHRKAHLRASRPNRIRFRFSDHGYDPTDSGYGADGTWFPNSDGTWVWEKYGDLYDEFNEAFCDEGNQVEILSAELNATSIGVKDRYFIGPLSNNSSLVSVGDIYMPFATRCWALFDGCTSLASVGRISAPLLEDAKWMLSYTALDHYPEMYVPNVTDATGMFYAIGADSLCPYVDHSKLVYTADMYEDCPNLSVDLGDIDMPECLDACWMFSCSPVRSVGDIRLPKCDDVSGMFYRCEGLTAVGDIYAPCATWAKYTLQECKALSTLGNVRLDACDTVYQLVQGCPELTSVGDIYAPKATSAYEMLDSCTKLVSTGDIVLTSVENAAYLFYGCSSLPSIGALATSSSLRKATGMFQGCSALQATPTFNASGVEVARSMLRECSSLTSFSADMPSLSDAYFMFYKCTALAEVDLGRRCDGITNASWMFYQCSSLVRPPELSTRYALTHDYMFYGCSSLAETPEIDLSSSESARYAFGECTALARGNVSGKSCPKLASTASMFRNCLALTEVGHFDTSHVSDANSMFYNCIALGKVPDYDFSEVTDISYFLAAYREGSTDTDDETFYMHVTQVPVFSLPRATDTATMFQMCRLLDNVSLDAPLTEELRYAFYGCRSLRNLYLAPCSPRTVRNAFYHCHSLPSETLEGLGTGLVESFSFSFSECLAFRTLPTLDLSSASDVSNTFSGCSNAESNIYASYVRMTERSSITAHSQTFRNCGVDSPEGSAELAKIPSSWK